MIINKNKMIVALVIVVVALGLSFYSGTKYAQGNVAAAATVVVFVFVIVTAAAVAASADPAVVAAAAGGLSGCTRGAAQPASHRLPSSSNKPGKFFKTGFSRFATRQRRPGCRVRWHQTGGAPTLPPPGCGCAKKG